MIFFKMGLSLLGRALKLHDRLNNQFGVERAINGMREQGYTWNDTKICGE